MFCRNCGYLVPDGCEYCPKCGCRASDLFDDLNASPDRPAAEKFSYFSLLSPRGWFSFRGRLSRKSYWIRLIMLTLLFMAPAYTIYLCTDDQGNIRSVSASVLALAMIAALVTAHLSLWTRRLHDLNLPGWLTAILFLLSFIPMAFQIICLILGCLPGRSGRNAYGQDPSAGS
ncbi:MAG: DUF805 domain-containing protein [Succinivibrionaceae bacterium]|jgi:uncharacterized membrane protein YhaH (DUF805 family)|nr:DUF805 domain-containing protein [Pseudomonadota bacterium]MDY6273485.1 DUF805 domain-containing protein [Succinivibrionaceae bacterium]MDY6336065.1 DUF805 domain-containing protein [Succinivibrionaceae bacterium]